MFNKKNNLRGSVIAYSLVITATVSIILVSIVQFIISQTKYSLYSHSKEESIQIAEAGIYFYRWYLAHTVEGKTAQQVKAFWTGNPAPIGVGTPPCGQAGAYEVEYKDPQGSALGKYCLEVTPPAAGSTIVVIKSTGWTYKYPDYKRTVKVRYRKPSWSEYAVLGNDFNRFGTGTDVQGKIFSNGGVHFDGVAHNVVSSAVSTYYDSDSDVKAWKPGVWTAWSNEYNSDMNSNVFLAGKKYPATTKDFSSVSADLNLMKAEAQAGTNGSKYFDNTLAGRHIILKADGTFSIRTVKNYFGSSNDINQYSGSWASYSIPDDGVIFVENNVWLEGTVQNKRVTIVAANLISANKANVFIDKDIRYTNYDGSDIIGVLAENDVEIIKNSSDILRIDAALLAQEGRVGRKYYSSTCPCGWTWCEDHKNTITVFGAIATNHRYGFAWGDNCPRNTGYLNRNIYYDNNLLYFPPPYFPTGTQYLLDLWEEL